MIAKLDGPVFGPYHCTNCMMRQPNDNLKSTCVFCGYNFSNYEDILITEDAERFLLHMKESELQNESNIHGKD